MHYVCFAYLIERTLNRAFTFVGFSHFLSPSHLINFWKKMFVLFLSTCCETLIFMFLGVSLVVDHHRFRWNTSFIFLTLLFITIARAVGESITACSFLSQKILPASIDWFFQCSDSWIFWMTLFIHSFADLVFRCCKSDCIRQQNT